MVEIVGAAEKAGVRVVEVTLDSERALEQIHALASAFPGLVVGAGSARSSAHVADANDAGTRFIVATVTRQAIAVACDGLKVALIPAAATLK